MVYKVFDVAPGDRQVWQYYLHFIDIGSDHMSKNHQRSAQNLSFLVCRHSLKQTLSLQNDSSDTKRVTLSQKGNRNVSRASLHYLQKCYSHPSCLYISIFSILREGIPCAPRHREKEPCKVLENEGGTFVRRNLVQRTHEPITQF